MGCWPPPPPLINSTFSQPQALHCIRTSSPRRPDTAVDAVGKVGNSGSKWDKSSLHLGRLQQGVHQEMSCRDKTFLFLGESQVRSAARFPLRRSAPCPHLRVQPPPASWPWPSLAMGSSRSLTCAGCKVAGSHHPRALSGRGEKPIRGSEAALRSVSYPP